MARIKDAIATLERIDPNGIGTEKIKTIVKKCRCVDIYYLKVIQ